MILRNKSTLEKIEISYFDFRKKFSKEIQVAFESFEKTKLNKTFYNFKDANLIESNYYFDIQWNFNHFGVSNWYIEKMN